MSVMSMHHRVLPVLFLCGLVAYLGSLRASAQAGAPAGNQIGIFNLTTIHATPLAPEILKRTVEGNVITEEVRFTSVPGVRVFGYFSYPKGGKKLPGTLLVRYAGAESRKVDAQGGFVGFSISAPCGNTDAAKKESLGGVSFNQTFVDDPSQSWIYHHVVALTRALDYMASRPEVDMKRVVVMGYSWAGYVTALLHALDNRPCAYITWHGAGYYADENGLSGGQPSLIGGRKYYEMYAPSAYAKYGTQPIYIASALTDYFSTFDGLTKFYKDLKCPKLLSVSPNRYHAETSRNEFRGSSNWSYHWQNRGPAPPRVTDGVVAVQDGKLTYTFSVTATQAVQHAEVLYSYGVPGDWTGRTWHRKPAEKRGTQYVCEIPVYDPTVPFYALAQIETAEFGGTANTPQFVEPAKLGAQRTALYPKTLMDFEDGSDLYVSGGTVTFVPDAPQGKLAASITPFHDGTVHLMNFEAFLWKNPKELRFYMKGDGKPGPVNVYVSFDSFYWLYIERKNYTKFTLIGENEIFPATWKEYTIPVELAVNLEHVDSLFFEMGSHTLLIDDIRWQ